MWAEANTAFNYHLELFPFFLKCYRPFSHILTLKLVCIPLIDRTIHLRCRMLSSIRFFAVLSLAIFLSNPVASQQGIVYTATVIPAIAQSGGSTTIRIQITAWTTDAERAQLKQVFAQDGPDKGMAFLRSM